MTTAGTTTPAYDHLATLYRSRWILPIVRSPIRDGWLLVDDGLIVDVGARPAPPPARVSQSVDLGAVAVLPGLVNAHVHLELSALRGRVRPAATMPRWVTELLVQRERLRTDEVTSAIGTAIEEAQQSGTALAGDVSNTLASCGPLARGRLRAVVFHELVGFNLSDPGGLVRSALAALAAQPAAAHVRLSLAPHAPYSVAPALFAAIREALAEDPSRPTSVHLAESREELDFLRRGSGPWRMLLEALGAWNPAWAAPNCGPVAYLERVGFLDHRALVVHGVQLKPPELERLAAIGATVVTCPRSNRWTGAGVPPVAAFYASGVRVAVGTDSLASVEDLNLFAELAELRRLAPGVSAATILDSATRCGADALGFNGLLGRIEPGARAAIIAVDVPESIADVEEYLLTGIGPDEVRWIDAGW